MMILLSFVLRFIFVALVSTEAAAESRNCVDRLNNIFLAESNLTNDKEIRTYILCPETVYEIGDSSDGSGEYDYGHTPLILGRSNIHVLCGDDGKSENNCVLKGGHVQAHLSDRFQTGDEIKNVLLQGITFSESSTHSVLAEYQGQMMILDCRFEVRFFVFNCIHTGRYVCLMFPFRQNDREIRGSLSFFLICGPRRVSSIVLGSPRKLLSSPRVLVLSESLSKNPSLL